MEALQILNHDDFKKEKQWKEKETTLNNKIFQLKKCIKGNVEDIVDDNDGLPDLQIALMVIHTRRKSFCSYIYSSRRKCFASWPSQYTDNNIRFTLN